MQWCQVLPEVGGLCDGAAGQATAPRPTPRGAVLRRPLLAEALPETASGPPRAGLGTHAGKGVKTGPPALEISLGLCHVTRNGL